MEWDPQVWAQVGVIGVAFGWLLLWTTSRLQAVLDRNTDAIEKLSRQVQINTLLVARMSGQDADDLEKLLANGSGR